MSFADVVSTLMFAGGGFFVLVGGIGAIRMPDLFTRMHASSLTDTLGSLLILGALMLQSGFDLVTLKLGVIAIFLVFTSPISAYALANSALNAGYNPKRISEDLTETKVQGHP